jgi:hypothetical protein
MLAAILDDHALNRGRPLIGFTVTERHTAGLPVALGGYLTGMGALRLMLDAANKCRWSVVTITIADGGRPLIEWTPMAGVTLPGLPDVKPCVEPELETP